MGVGMGFGAKQPHLYCLQTSVRGTEIKEDVAYQACVMHILLGWEKLSMLSGFTVSLDLLDIV
jgi:hypothetical protein